MVVSTPSTSGTPNLTIHGPWPEYRNGSWPQFCSNETLQNTTIQSLQPALQQYWPSVVAETDQHHLDFWSHEWSKHGTCSGLEQLQYFRAALNHYIDTPSLISDSYVSTVNASQLRKAYGDGVFLICTGGGLYLSEVRACLALNGNGQPTLRIACPETVLIEDSCSYDTLKLAKFSTQENSQ